MQTPGIMPHQTVTTIVENVDQARHDIAQAFTLLQGAKDRLKAVLGEDTYSANLWERDPSDYNLADAAATVDAFQARNAWRYILEHTGIQHYMTEHRKQELEDQLKAGTFPVLTVANVLSTLEGLRGRVGDFLNESVIEVFQWLRPQAPWGTGALKTNKKYRVGYKIITDYCIDHNSSGGFHVRYGMKQRIRALGNVFSLLDGQGVERYPDDLYTRMNAAIKHLDSGEKFTVPYMTGKCYGNGNLHLTFTRHDLVDRLNQIGSDGSLGQREDA
jgi:hypothetical protein